ncbi:DoxX family membrane protein [uncultured Cellulomonas sp.]|uniref:DoxX family membrane protein n=1 Tax=uncultured Cellulomonas sp. TaxID=189682 RepID=UPI0028EAC5B9|nr:DoxX family membrane protein [uncultured Cellulomonas sp.]
MSSARPLTSSAPKRHTAAGTSAPVPSNTLARPAVVVARVESGLAGFLTRYSIAALRISLGLVFLGFGVLKFFPGMSPAAELAERTIGTLTFGLVGPTAALLLTATLETVIGLTLVTGLFLRTGLVILAGALVGIMSPIVLFYGELFPAGGPTLTGQYVLKDVVLACAGAVVAAAALGARLRLPRE